MVATAEQIGHRLVWIRLRADADHVLDQRQHVAEGGPVHLVVGGVRGKRDGKRGEQEVAK